MTALLLGLTAGLAWVPAAGVSTRLTAMVVLVAALVVATGRQPRQDQAHATRPRGLRGLDTAATLALALALATCAGAALVPP